MSTKIFDAYRIPKSEFEDKFITDILYDLKLETRNTLINSAELLRAIHALTISWVRKNKDNDELLEFLSEQDIPDWGVYEYLEECERNETIDPIFFDIDFDCSVFEDEDYWYLKFYANQRWQWNLLEEWDEKYEWLEDFHYQNSTDPPSGFTHEEFRKRGDKWDELLKDEGTFRNGLHYIFMNADEFRLNVLWQHDKELAYKFDGVKKVK